MSTILKALRRLEEDGPGESPSGATTSEAGASPTIPATEPRATDELRDRILAEERANEVTTAPGARGSEASTEADVISVDSQAAALRMWAPLAALAIAILVLGIFVVPAVLESGSGSESSSAVAAGPSADQAERGEPIPPQPESQTTVAAATPTYDTAVSPTAASVPAPPAVAPPAPKIGSSPNTLVAAAPSTRPATSTSLPASANTPTTSMGPVAVADLPIASVPADTPAPAAQPSPLRAPSPAQQLTPPATRAVPVEPTPTAVELALVEPANAPPAPKESSATAPPSVERKPAPPRAALRTNPAPLAPRKPAPTPIQRAPIKPSRATPERDRATSSAGPVAKTADAAPIERIARPDVPDVTIVRTAWHPSSDRRSAKVRLEATDEVLTLREGDAIGALVVKEISPSAVLFETGGVELRRRVGSGSGG